MPAGYHNFSQLVDYFPRHWSLKGLCPIVRGLQIRAGSNLQNNKPVASRACLQGLPLEVIIAILENLDWKSILNVLTTNSF